MPNKHPRDYQLKINRKLFEYIDTNPEKNPVMAIPCGGGKSGLQAMAIIELWKRNPNIRTLAVCHVKEIVLQNAEELLEFSDELQPSIFCAGLNKYEIGKFTFASIASIIKKVEHIGKIDYLFFDECHVLPMDSKSMYRKLLINLQKTNPNIRVIGYSATPFRLGLGYITDGDLFDDIVVNATYMESFTWFIDNGYLVQMISKHAVTQLDVTDVHIRGGDFVQSELQKSVDKAEITYAALAESCKYGHNRNHWIVFASGVEHAEHITAMLNDEFDIPATVVHSKMNDAQRDANIEAFKRGEYRAIVNNLVLTIGSNLPILDLCIDLAPTTSPARHIQKYGRVSRPLYAKGYDLSNKEGRLAAIANSDKTNALILDFSGNTMRNGCLNAPRIPRKKGEGGSGEAPIKACPECLTLHHTSRRICNTVNVLTGITCEHEFEFKTKLTVEAANESVIKRNVEPVHDWFHVTSVSYGTKMSSKDKSKPMLVVTYQCAMNRFTEYVLLEHDGFAKSNAKKWWRTRQIDGVPPIPETVIEALEHSSKLLTPKMIYVETNTKYPKIKEFAFE